MAIYFLMSFAYYEMNEAGRGEGDRSRWLQRENGFFRLTFGYSHNQDFGMSGIGLW